LLMRDQENIEKGREEGREEGIHAMIRSLHSLKIDDSTIVEQLMKEFHLSKDEAKYYLVKEAVPQ